MSRSTSRLRTIAVTFGLILAEQAAAAAPASLGSGMPASVSVPTAAFAPDGRLWAVWVDPSGVYAGSSRDLGRTFAPPVRVSSDGESIDANGEARPKLALGPRGEVYVSYTRKGQSPFTGDIRFARRLPDGRFSTPITVNDDGLLTGHRFDTLAVSPKGAVHLAWIDKRDLEHAKEKGLPYEGAALYEAVSTDGGRSFGANRKIKEGICECCRLAFAWDGETPVLLWRDILAGGVRDHSIARLEEGRQPVIERATDDGWRIDGCPHHGPALAVGRDGTWHMAWFTGEGKRGGGLFYQRSADGGRSFSEPMQLASGHASHPAVLAIGTTVWLAWKDTDGDTTVVRTLHSDDGGAHWSAPRVAARTRGASDHPLLVARREAAFLSWLASDEGYRLIELH